MPAQSLLARLGLRVATLGSVASLAIAAPIAEGSVSQTAHTAPTRSGFFFPTPDSLAVVTNGVERVRVFSDGGVQIGGTYGASPGAGVLALAGSTSGVARIKAAAVAGSTAPLVLPATDGSSGFVLSTDGSGTLSWIAAGGGGGSIGGGISTNQVAYGSGANTITGSANFTYDGLTLTVAGNIVAVLGTRNYAYGVGSLAALTTGYDNIAIGDLALQSVTSGRQNIAIGHQTLQLNTTGTRNVAIGEGSLGVNTTASSNTAVGVTTLAAATGASATYNTAIGANALAVSTSAGSNTAVGGNAANKTTTGPYNTAVGTTSLYYNTTGDHNTAIGYNAGTGTTLASLSYCTFLGAGAKTDANGYTNATAIGSGAIATASNQVFLGDANVTEVKTYGKLTLAGTTSGSISIKAAALAGTPTDWTLPTTNGSNGYALVTDGAGTLSWAAPTTSPAGADTQVQYNNAGAFGASSGFTYSGGSLTVSGADSYFNGVRVGIGAGASGVNTVVGYLALDANTTGTFNSAFGYKALSLNTNGNFNSAFGKYSLFVNTSGYMNSAFGTDSLVSNTVGYENSGFGMQVLKNNIDGINNSAFGRSALFSNTSGSSNTALGFKAGYNSGVSLTTLDSCTFLGALTSASANALTNSTAIGNSAQVTASNQIVLGNISVTEVKTYGKLTFAGTASGSLSIKVAAAAGTPTDWTLPTTNGSSGYVLTTNGAGTLTWAAATATPAGSTTQVQYNNAGSLAGSAALLTNGTTVAVGGAALTSSTFMAVAAATTARSSINIAQGTAPTAIQNGDMWMETVNGLRYAHNGFNYRTVGSRLDGSGCWVTELASGTSTATGTVTPALKISQTHAGNYVAAQQTGGILTEIVVNGIPSGIGKQFLATSTNLTADPSDDVPLLTEYVATRSYAAQASVSTLRTAQATLISGLFQVYATGSPTGGAYLSGFCGVKVVPQLYFSGGSGSTTIANFYGFWMAPSTFDTIVFGASTIITNFYGIKLDVVTASGAGTTTITNRYGVYQDDTLAKNVFRGDITKIRDVVTSFPSVQGGANTYLKNDGSGNLSWAAAAAAAGSNTQLQYNNGGAFGASANLTFSGSALTIKDTLTLDGATSGSLSIKAAAIAGSPTTWTLPTGNGFSGYVLTTDGSGTLSWAASSSSPAGSTTQVQYNNAGAFGASSAFTFDSSATAAQNLYVNTTSTGSSCYAGLFSVQANPSSTSSQYVGVLGTAQVADSANMTSGYIIGVQGSGQAFYTSTASIGGAFGGQFDALTQMTVSGALSVFSTRGLYARNSMIIPSGTGTMTVTNAYGAYIELLTSAVTSIDITNAYGLYVKGTIGTGTITNRYGIYQDDASALNVFTGNVAISTAGKGLQIKEGSNAKMGRATMAAGTVTVSTTAVTANSRIFLTSNVDGGVNGFLRVSAITAGTSFVITSSNIADTSQVAWMIVEAA